MLQKVSYDLQSSMNLIKSIQRFLENMTSDDEVNGVITEATESLQTKLKSVMSLKRKLKSTQGIFKTILLSK